MFKKIFNYIKRKNKMITNFTDCSHLLQSGEYIFSNSMSYIHLKNEEVDKRAKNMFSNNSKITIYKIFDRFVKKMFFNENIIIHNSEAENKKFIGSVYLPANNNDNKKAKIFDFDNNKVLSIYSLKNDYIRENELYVEFSGFFKIPEIILSDDVELVLIEKLIEFKSNLNWSNNDYIKVMDEIFKNYINYYNNCEMSNEYVLKTPLELLNSLKDQEKVDFLRKNINTNLMNKKLPFIKIHGDLWSANILIDKDNKNDIYFIDWEHSDNFILFYDFFWLMQNEAIYNENYFYLEQYIKGYYNHYFKEIFLIFDIKFEEKYKVDYLIIFFVNVFETRLKDKNKKTNDIVYNRFKNIFSYIISM